MSSGKLTQASKTPQTSTVLQASIWCGLVFALVSLFCVLNALPPVSVAYQSKTQVILSATRLKQLEKHLETPEPKKAAGTDGFLARIDVLDRKLIQETLPGVASTPKSQESLLVEIYGEWEANPSTGNVLQWIEKLSALPGDIAEETTLARQLRHLRWQLTAAEHYAARQQHVAEAIPSPPSTDGRTFKLASATIADGVPAGARHVQGKELSAELLDEVDAKRKQLAAIERAWTKHVASLSGEFRAAGKHRIAVTPSRVPTHLAASVLVMGLAMGAIAGWFQFRMQSGGVYMPERVAEQLAGDGFPHVGTVQIIGFVSEEPGWLSGLAKTMQVLPRTIGRGFTRICEMALAAWCILIVCRFLTDPLWRDMLASSPLAAFGRLISGLP